MRSAARILGLGLALLAAVLLVRVASLRSRLLENADARPKGSG
jgi:hypothetical protein